MPARGPHRSHIPGPEEEARFLDAVGIVNPDDELIYWLLYHRGLRVGEVVGNHRGRSSLPGLQIEDLRENGIWVRGKKKHEDFIQLPPERIAQLRELAGTRKTGLIFEEVGSYADPVGTVDRRTKEYAHIAGLDDWENFHPHASRHAFAYRVAQLTGGDAFKVRDALRIKTAEGTGRYVHGMSQGEKARLYSQMDRTG